MTAITRACEVDMGHERGCSERRVARTAATVMLRQEALCDSEEMTVVRNGGSDVNTQQQQVGSQFAIEPHG
jgi:hypothetical protein